MPIGYPPPSTPLAPGPPGVPRGAPLDPTAGYGSVAGTPVAPGVVPRLLELRHMAIAITGGTSAGYLGTSGTVPADEAWLVRRLDLGMTTFLWLAGETERITLVLEDTAGAGQWPVAIGPPPDGSDTPLFLSAPYFGSWWMLPGQKLSAVLFGPTATDAPAGAQVGVLLERHQLLAS